MLAGDSMTVKFGLKQTPTPPDATVADSADLANWSAGTHYYTGDALITSLTANANNGDNATYSVTLTGVSQIKKVGTVPAAAAKGK